MPKASCTRTVKSDRRISSAKFHASYQDCLQAESKVREFANSPGLRTWVRFVWWGKILSADDKLLLLLLLLLLLFSYFIPEKEDLTFHANSFHWRQLGWSVISIFSGKKYWENISKRLLKVLSRKLSVNNLHWILARLYEVQEESTGTAIALPPASALASALTKMFKFYVKVFKTLYFLNPQMDLLYILYDYRCWSKILFSAIHTTAHDLEVKVTDIEICVNKNVIKFYGKV